MSISKFLKDLREGKEPKVRYNVIVNGEWVTSCDNEEQAWDIAIGYQNDDSGYYGMYPNAYVETEYLDESLEESQSQEIGQAYKRLSDRYGVDFDELVYGRDGFMNSLYPRNPNYVYFPDFDGDVIYSEKHWNELADWALKNRNVKLQRWGEVDDADTYGDELIKDFEQRHPWNDDIDENLQEDKKYNFDGEYTFYVYDAWGGREQDLDSIKEVKQWIKHLEKDGNKAIAIGVVNDDISEQFDTLEELIDYLKEYEGFDETLKESRLVEAPDDMGFETDDEIEAQMKAEMERRKAERDAKKQAELDRQERERARQKAIEDAKANGQELYDKCRETDDFDDWFDYLVPREGTAPTVAGEIYRAIARIIYRDFNDGDKFYEGYGRETCGSSAT